jgi:hypothetical protein
LRCRIRYWIDTETRAGHAGWQRFVSQTTNPRRPGEPWNHPKEYTYAPRTWMYLDGDGHVRCAAVSQTGIAPHVDAWLRLVGIYDQMPDTDRLAYDELLALSKGSRTAGTGGGTRSGSSPVTYVRTATSCRRPATGSSPATASPSTSVTTRTRSQPRWPGYAWPAWPYPARSRPARPRRGVIPVADDIDWDGSTPQSTRKHNAAALTWCTAPSTAPPARRRTCSRTRAPSMTATESSYASPS